MTWNSNTYKNRWGELENFYQNNKIIMPVKFSWSALFSSKTVWLNVLATVVAFATYLQSVAEFDKYAVLIGGILVLGNLILKIWFNNSAIASTPTLST
jgi:hypothetical protein